MSQDMIEVLELHRMCLDFKKKISKAAVIDILPNRHLWKNVNKDWAKAYWHWV